MSRLLFSPDPIFILILKYKHQTDNNLQVPSGFPVDHNDSSALKTLLSFQTKLCLKVRVRIYESTKQHP